MVLMPRPHHSDEDVAAKLLSLLLFMSIVIATLVVASAVALPAIASGRCEQRVPLVRIGALFVGKFRPVERDPVHF